MAREIKPVEEEVRGAPAYIVSMSALWTILLSFFILMCTMAQEQKSGFIAAGTGSFIRELNSFGLTGLMTGTRNAVRFANNIPNYGVNEEDLDETTPLGFVYRELKADDKRLEHLSQLPPRKVVLRRPTTIHFERGSHELSRPARRELDLLLRRIRDTSYKITIESYVDPTASFVRPPTDPAQFWGLSVQRAKAVADYFHTHGGIPRRRLVPVGYGQYRPVIEKTNEHTAAVNDRVVISIYAN